MKGFKGYFTFMRHDEGKYAMFDKENSSANHYNILHESGDARLLNTLKYDGDSNELEEELTNIRGSSRGDIMTQTTQTAGATSSHIKRATSNKGLDKDDEIGAVTGDSVETGAISKIIRGGASNAGS